MTITARYQLIRQQNAYTRRIAAFGLPALLAPYTLRQPVSLPQQRSPHASRAMRFSLPS